MEEEYDYDALLREEEEALNAAQYDQMEAEMEYYTAQLSKESEIHSSENVIPATMSTSTSTFSNRNEEEQKQSDFEDRELIKENRRIARRQSVHKIRKEPSKNYLFDRPENSDDIHIVLPRGEMKYLRMNRDPFALATSKDEFVKNAYAEDFQFSSSYETLLEESLKVAEQQERIAKMFLEESNDETENVPTQLLTDKYTPRHFIDLVSNEKNNREVLRWIQSWHEFVFNRGTEHARPQEKVILICGPPGTGKSTLARVAAMHAGYNPVEINASEQRTPAMLNDRITGAMSMKSVFHNKLPNCIILDEAEGMANLGSGKGATQMIIDMVNCPLKHIKRDHEIDNDDEGSAETENKARKINGKHLPVTRPIILICNDAFAPVLRAIKRVAKVIYMNPPIASQITTRLQTICSKEGYTVQHGALELLCEQSQRDIRHCLHALQFAMTVTEHKRIRMDAIEAVCDGTKDMSSNLVLSWRNFFQRSNVRVNRSLTKQTRFENNYRNIQSHGSEFGKFFEGLFENIYQTPLENSTIANLADIAESFSHIDTMINNNSMHYVTCAGMTLMRFAKVTGKCHITFPQAHSAYVKRAKQNAEILDAFYYHQKRFAPGQLFHRHVASMYEIPAILDILAPSVRKLPWNLLSATEKEIVTNTSRLMIGLGLSFVRVTVDAEDAADGQASKKPEYLQQLKQEFKPQPRIDKLVDYSSKDKQLKRPMFCASTCELLSTRMNFELVSGSSSNTEPTWKPKNLTAKARVVENSGKELGAPKRNFFNQIIVEQPPLNKTHSRVSAPDDTEQNDLCAMDNNSEEDQIHKRARNEKGSVVFTFHEGCTDAVRRPVLINDFLM